jgi:cold shock CspA family protein/arsenate reductase-like glutaredoxin family protein
VVKFVMTTGRAQQQDCMIKGTIKFFSKAKGFGFISPDGGTGKDVFLPMAVITAAGVTHLAAGQRISFETEPDPKGPKAVSLKLLDEKPVPPPADKPQDKQRPAPAPRAEPAAFTLYHDPDSDDSEDVLAALEEAGIQPRLVNYRAAPPTPEELKRLSLLLREAGQSTVRRFDPLFLALQLDDRFIGEGDFWRSIVEHPMLINGPILARGDKVRVCKTEEDVRAFLGKDSVAEQAAKPKGLSPRMLAMLSGGVVPPPEPKKPAPVPKPEPAPVKAEAKAAKAPAKPAAKKAPAKPAAKKPAAKAVKKVAAKKKK